MICMSHIEFIIFTIIVVISCLAIVITVTIFGDEEVKPNSESTDRSNMVENILKKDQSENQTRQSGRNR